MHELFVHIVDKSVVLMDCGFPDNHCDQGNAETEKHSDAAQSDAAI